MVSGSLPHDEVGLFYYQPQDSFRNLLDPHPANKRGAAVHALPFKGGSQDGSIAIPDWPLGHASPRSGLGRRKARFVLEPAPFRFAT